MYLKIFGYGKSNFLWDFLLQRKKTHTVSKKKRSQLIKQGLFTIAWSDWDLKNNEPPNISLNASRHPEKRMLCIWWDWKLGYIVGVRYRISKFIVTDHQSHDYRVPAMFGLPWHQHTWETNSKMGFLRLTGIRWKDCRWYKW